MVAVLLVPALVSSACACACAPGAPPPAVVTVASPAPPPRREPAPRSSRCYPDGAPPPIAEAPRAEPLCRPVARGEASGVRRELKRRFRQSDPATSVEIDLGCDPLGERISEIVVEQGSEQASSLVLWRLTRKTDDFEASRYEITTRYNATDPQSYAIASRFDAALGRGSADATRVDSALVRARSSLLSAVREVAAPYAAPAGPVPPTPPGAAPAAPSNPGSPGAFAGAPRGATSQGLVLGVRLVDAQGRTLERWFAGADAAAAQGALLPIELAASALAPALEGVALAPAPANDADRAFFAERFRVARGRFADPALPLWTRQAFVALAGPLGSSVLVGTWSS